MVYSRVIRVSLTMVTSKWFTPGSLGFLDLVQDLVRGLGNELFTGGEQEVPGLLQGPARVSGYQRRM